MPNRVSVHSIRDGPFMGDNNMSRIALILSGGGARAAYQVGVLSGIAEWYDKQSPVPFPVIVGTSAGAMNATYLAANMAQFGVAAEALVRLWSQLEVKQVYRSEYRKILGVLLHWGWSLISGGLGDANPRSLLDNAPLRELLATNINFERISEHIERGCLHGIAVTVAGYATERSLSYFQAAPGVQSWWRRRREGRSARLNLDHVMASLGLPTVFPAVNINGEWCCDGSTRQFAPLSPAIHLGAERVLVIDPQYPAPQRVRNAGSYPSLSKIMGYLFDTIFSDSLYADLERLERINRTLEYMREQMGREPMDLGLNRIETLVIAPSQHPVEIAARYVASLPKAMRWVLRSLGGEVEGGDQLLSYMLFEGAYCREMIALGRHDAQTRRHEISRFLGLSQVREV